MTRPGATPADSSAAPAGARYGAVLVPLDGSELAERALGPAAWLAQRFGADLHQVSAAVPRDERWWYEDYAVTLAARHPGSTLHLSDEHDVAGAIVATARDLEPCLVCMGTHGRARSAAIVGSTFAAVAARGAAPLLAVGPRAVAHTDEQAGRIVVCLDGGAMAEQALPLAAAWAHRLGLRLSLVTATDPILVSHEEAAADRRYGPTGDPGGYLDAVAGRPVLAGLDVDTQVMWGLAFPHVGIGEALERHPAALVVATSHARHGMARAALGSETAKIVRRSPSPVLVQPAARA